MKALFSILFFSACLGISAQEIVPNEFIERDLQIADYSLPDKEELMNQIALLSREINLNPNLTEPYVKRGRAKVSLGDFRGAIADFDKAVNLKAGDAELIAERAQARVRMGDYKAAVMDYTQAIALNPSLAGVYMQRAYAKKQLGDLRGAAADFAEERKLRPQDEGAYLLGLERYFAGDYRAAIAHFDTAISINPAQPQFHYHRAKSLAQLGEYQAAIGDFDKAIEGNPTDISAIVQRGLSSIKVGALDAGCLDLSRAGELGYERAYELIRKYCSL